MVINSLIFNILFIKNIKNSNYPNVYKMKLNTGKSIEKLDSNNVILVFLIFLKYNILIF